MTTMIVAPKRLPKETWALIRRDYLMGLTAGWLASQYGTTVAAIRKRAENEGWSRAAFYRVGAAGAAPLVEGGPTAAMEATQGPGAAPPDEEAGAPEDEPAEPGIAALAAAPESPSLLLEGLVALRRAFRQDRIHDAERLLEMVETVASWGPPPEGPPPPHRRFRDVMLAEPELYTKVLLDVWGLARELAEAALAEPGRDVAAPFARLVVKWRAEFLGEDIAAADLERFRAAGGEAYAAVFDEDGNVREGLVPPAPAEGEPEGPAQTA